jgi:hypothetical protein
MDAKLKDELRRLRNNRFYYVGPDVTEQIWRDGDGKLHDMYQMELGHLQACIRLIDKDLAYLHGSSIVSQEAALRIGTQSLAKKRELEEVFARKSKI